MADERGENSGDVLSGAPGRIQTTVARVLLFGGAIPAFRFGNFAVFSWSQSRKH